MKLPLYIIVTIAMAFTLIVTELWRQYIVILINVVYSIKGIFQGDYRIEGHRIYFEIMMGILAFILLNLYLIAPFIFIYLL